MTFSTVSCRRYPRCWLRFQHLLVVACPAAMESAETGSFVNVHRVDG